ncbi:hypothetical protein CSOJ01_12506 [Colletotrichum sojae]|uniref:Phosphotransferase enzyme family protein n=1 Tax=Colletotrichum sojae TaxID=2175907 RepID=A0A8H6IVC2_9PEZI|nr:hypothetical protein CSOJ01_12506 [Colletotrichum sojae]
MTEPEPINAGRLARALTLLSPHIGSRPISPTGPAPRRASASIRSSASASRCGRRTWPRRTRCGWSPSARTSRCPRYTAHLRTGGRTYMVMSRIDGQMACYGWKARSEASRRRILDQLRDMVAQIRTIKPAENVGVANVVGGPVYDCRFPDEKHLGPCATVQDFHKKLLGFDNLNFRATGELSELNEVLDFYGDYDEDPVFTHGDLISAA